MFCYAYHGCRRTEKSLRTLREIFDINWFCNILNARCGHNSQRSIVLIIGGEVTFDTFGFRIKNIAKVLWDCKKVYNFAEHIACRGPIWA